MQTTTSNIVSLQGGNIPLNKPYLPKFSKYQKYLKIMYENVWLTNNGPLVQEFSQRLANYLGVKYLVPVSSGTAALQLAYKLFGLTGNVITTPFSFIATSSSIEWAGREIRFADIDRQTFNISPHEVANLIDENTSAIVPVHVYGNPCDTSSLDQLCKSKNLKIIYDAAHAFGIEKNGKSILSAGDASAISFHATKLFHSIEGGALVLNNESDFKRAKEMINFGICADTGKIEKSGFNGKMSEAHAAMGLAMLDDIEQVIEKRLELYNLYKKLLSDSVDYPVWDKDANQNAAYFPIVLETEQQAEFVFKALSRQNIQSRKYFSPSLNKLKHLTNQKESSCPVSENISLRVLCLPLFYNLSKSDVKAVCKIILNTLRHSHK